MVTNSGSVGYTGTAKVLHWLVVGLLIVQFCLAWTMPMGLNAPVETLISLHFSFGVLIFLVAIIRLGWRLIHGEPAPLDGIPPWQVQSARLVHWLLYALIFLLPIFGWLNASWRGMPVTFFGLFEVPELIPKHAPGWRWTGSVHVFGAEYALLGLVGLHVAAALYHYVIRRDGVLQRMLPGR
ncbi:MAG TPA: cytochrome b [Pseudolabrys sp.]|jgi:cytochrome b561